MSKIINKNNKYYNYNTPEYYNQDNSYSEYVYSKKYRAKTRYTTSKRKKNRQILLKFIGSVFITFFAALYLFFICPYNFRHYFAPLYLNRILNSNYSINVSDDYLFPTRDYLYNSSFLDKKLLVPKSLKSKEMTNIIITSELSNTKNKLLNLSEKYPNLKPSIFVWEYSTGKGLEINADEIYPSASIIKLPILFELIRLIDFSSDTINPVSLSDIRVFKEEYRTLGSGSLQRKKAGNHYTLDHLAKIMITDSDNSATNMILYEIGGVDNFNRFMRNYGLNVTSMAQWLPDLEGYNKTTAREISTILYNMDNPKYINPKYIDIIKNYLSETKNVHLLKENLPKDTLVLHKTGNIASMIGDSGIIYTKSGKKYIVSILVKRPRNDYNAKTFIQEASLIIYNDIN